MCGRVTLKLQFSKSTNAYVCLLHFYDRSSKSYSFSNLGIKFQDHDLLLFYLDVYGNCAGNKLYN